MLLVMGVLLRGDETWQTPDQRDNQHYELKRFHAVSPEMTLVIAILFFVLRLNAGRSCRTGNWCDQCSPCRLPCALARENGLLQGPAGDMLRCDSHLLVHGLFQFAQGLFAS